MKSIITFLFLVYSLQSFASSNSSIYCGRLMPAGNTAVMGNTPLAILTVEIPNRNEVETYYAAILNVANQETRSRLNELLASPDINASVCAEGLWRGDIFYSDDPENIGLFSKNISRIDFISEF